MEKVKFKTIEDYFDSQTEIALTALLRLRKNIFKIIPDAEEFIYYQIPALRYNGKPLIGYAAFKNHCSLYIMSMKTANVLKPSIKDFEVNGVTVKFGFKETLPKTLLKKIIKARIKETNDLIEKKQKIKMSNGFLSLLSSPARRALENKGIASLRQLSKFSEGEILALHGMGKSAIPKLKESLQKEGLNFKQ